MTSHLTRAALSLLAAAGALSIPIPHTFADVSLTWTGALSTSWTDGRNWGQSNASIYPNNGIAGNNYNADIGAPSPANLSVPTSFSITIQALTIESLGLLNITQGDIINLNGNLTDNGAISLNVGTLSFLANNSLSGNGTITIHGSAGITGTLSQSATHTINGNGTISASLTNAGTLNANVANQTLTLSHAMTNNNLFEATNGANLSIPVVTITQGSAGQILAGANSTVSLNIATINGGTLNTSGNGTINIINTTSTTTLSNITNNGTLNILRNASATVAGSSLTNNGIIVIDSNRFNFADSSALAFNANITLGGTGIIRLNGGASLGGSNITQTLTHTIDGWGSIIPTFGSPLTNNGNISADVSTQILSLGDINNNGLLEAFNGGILQLNGNITQFPAGQLLAASGAIQLNTATVTGGTLNATGGGFQASTGNSTLADLTNNAAIVVTAQFNLAGTLLTNNNSITLAPGSTTHITVATLVNNGLIVLSADSMHGFTGLTFSANTLLSGNGTLTMSDDGIAQSMLSADFGVTTVTQDLHHTIAGNGQINVPLINNGTIIANISGRTLQVSGSLTNTGLIRASNGGILQINAFPFTDVGTIIVDANSTFSTSSLTLNGGLLAGAGTVTAPVLAGNSPHTIHPGAPGNTAPATLSLSSLATNSNTTLAFDLTSPAIGLTPGASDRLAIAGALSLAGGHIQVTSTPTGPASLGYYRIIQYGTLSGSLASLILPAPANNIVYTLDLLHDSTFIDLHRGFLGDANDDGTINLADLNTVLNHFGQTTSAWTNGNFVGQSTINLTDLAAVLNHFGQSTPDNATSQLPTTKDHSPAAPAPEPASLCIAASSLALLLRRHKN